MITKDDLIEQRAQLQSYLLSRFKANDLHAVQDAASDIREIDAKLDVLREHETQTSGTMSESHAEQRRIG